MYLCISTVVDFNSQNFDPPNEIWQIQPCRVCVIVESVVPCGARCGCVLKSGTRASRKTRRWWPVKHVRVRPPSAPWQLRTRSVSALPSPSSFHSRFHCRVPLRARSHDGRSALGRHVLRQTRLAATYAGPWIALTSDKRRDRHRRTDASPLLYAVSCGRGRDVLRQLRQGGRDGGRVRAGHLHLPECPYL